MLRYNNVLLRYDTNVLRYDTPMLRYNNAILRYDTSLPRYDNSPLRQAAVDGEGCACGASGVFIAPARRGGRRRNNPIKSARRRADPADMRRQPIQWDADGNVRPASPAMTNAERQREFRRRHPDYYRLRQAKVRAELKAVRQARHLQALYAAMIAKPLPLALPAPAERIEIPGMNMIPAMNAINALREPAPLPVSQPATIPAAKRHAA